MVEEKSLEMDEKTLMPALLIGLVLAGIVGFLKFFEFEVTEKQKRANRGKRNNNPGNVRALTGSDIWRGQIGIDPEGFAIFDNITDGVRVMTIDIAGDIVKDGNNTLSGLMAEYAPNADGNDETAYTTFLSNLLGLKIDQVIPINRITELIFGIARFEGQPLYENWADAKVDLGIKEGFSHLGIAA